MKPTLSFKRSPVKQDPQDYFLLLGCRRSNTEQQQAKKRVIPVVP